MKKLFIALAATALFASCSKKDDVVPVTANQEVTKASVSRGPNWDVVNATYTQSFGPITNYASCYITFGTTWGGTTGTGDIWVAACNSSGVITSGWIGPYTANNYAASATTGRARVLGSKVAILFYPGVPGNSSAYPPASQAGYTVNTLALPNASDYMDLATVN